MKPAPLTGILDDPVSKQAVMRSQRKVGVYVVIACHHGHYKVITTYQVLPELCLRILPRISILMICQNCKHLILQIPKHYQ